MLDRYLENDGIAVHDYEDACDLARIILKNGNAVMITKEEELYIVTWVWCGEIPDRNDVVFRSRGSVECELAEEAVSDDV